MNELAWHKRLEMRRDPQRLDPTPRVTFASDPETVPALERWQCPRREECSDLVVNHHYDNTSLRGRCVREFVRYNLVDGEYVETIVWAECPHMEKQGGRNE